MINEIEYVCWCLFNMKSYQRRKLVGLLNNVTLSALLTYAKLHKGLISKATRSSRLRNCHYRWEFEFIYDRVVSSCRVNNTYCRSWRPLSASLSFFSLGSIVWSRPVPGLRGAMLSFIHLGRLKNGFRCFLPFQIFWPKFWHSRDQILRNYRKDFHFSYTEKL